MFKLKEWTDGKLAVYEFFDDRGTLARFMPGRGGLLTEFQAMNTPMFYLDRDSLHAPDKNVRGGNPVLFPICGPLENGSYTLGGGRIFKMNQHGLARNFPWQVSETYCGNGRAAITLMLTECAETLRIYPFKFKLLFTYEIEPQQITIRQRYINESYAEMPFYPGFHPYFFAPGAKVKAVRVPASGCTDLKAGQECEVSSELELNAREETNLLYSGLYGREAWFDRADGYRIIVRFREQFRNIILWALRDKEFLCLEPWMGSNYDLNQGKALRLGPGQELTTEVAYQLIKD